MNENKRMSEEMIRHNEDEVSKIIEEMTEAMENAVSQSAEEVDQLDSEGIDVKREAVKPETSEIIEESLEDILLPPKEKKHARARYLVEKAKKLVNESNQRADACKHLLETDLKEYEDAKSELRKGGLDACIALLKILKYQINDDDVPEEAAVVFEARETVKPMELEDISSGKFTGLFLALLGGFITAVAMVYLATEKLEMTLNVTKVPTEYETQSILAWFSTLLGIHEDMYIGAGVLGFTVLLVMFLIYMMRVRYKAKCNLHFAVKQFVEAQIYIDQRADCKTKIDKIDAHLKEAIAIVKTYEVLLNEQQGKLKRILHIEGEKSKSTEYHDKSYIEMRVTAYLIRTIKRFMAIPMSDEGEVSANSELYLQDAKNKSDKLVERFY